MALLKRVLRDMGEATGHCPFATGCRDELAPAPFPLDNCRGRHLSSASRCRPFGLEVQRVNARGAVPLPLSASSGCRSAGAFEARGMRTRFLPTAI